MMVVVSKGRALANQNGVAPGDDRALIRAARHLLTQQKGADVVGRGGGVEHHAVVGDVFDVRGRLFDGGLVHSLRESLHGHHHPALLADAAAMMLELVRVRGRVAAGTQGRKIDGSVLVAAGVD